jgi:DNA-directed RNA polymerase specialized sigma24 family protein
VANREALIGVGDLLLQMKITNRLIAAQLRNTMSQQDLIALLSTTGATGREIAEIVGTSEGTVKNALMRIRKKTIPDDRREQRLLE